MKVNCYFHVFSTGVLNVNLSMKPDITRSISLLFVVQLKKHIKSQLFCAVDLFYRATSIVPSFDPSIKANSPNFVSIVKTYFFISFQIHISNFKTSVMATVQNEFISLGICKQRKVCHGVLKRICI